MGLAGWPGWLVVGDDVVEVAVAGVGLAVGEHALGVAEPDLFGHPGRRVVPVHRIVAGQVHHGRDLDASAGGGVPGQPGLDPRGGDGAEALHKG